VHARRDAGVATVAPRTGNSSKMAFATKWYITLFVWRNRDGKIENLRIDEKKLSERGLALKGLKISSKLKAKICYLI